MLARVCSAMGLVACCASPAWAQGLESARRHYVEADFEAARIEFQALLDRPALTPREAVEGHRFLAVLDFIAGDADGARGHAQAALALDPEATVPEGAPSALALLFERIRAEGGGERAALRLEIRGRPLAQGGTSAVAARLEPAPAALATRLRLRCEGEGSGAVEQVGTPPEVEADVAAGPEAETIACRASAETGTGAVLLHTSVDLPVERVERPQQRPRRRVWPWIVGACAVVVAAGVVTAVVLTTSPQDAIIDRLTVEGW